VKKFGSQSEVKTQHCQFPVVNVSQTLAIFHNIRLRVTTTTYSGVLNYYTLTVS